MILRDTTIKYSGRDPDTLTKGSHVRVCCTCDECGRVRWCNYQSYRGLCGSCAKKGKNSSSWKEKIIKVCQICGEEYKVYPSQQHHKFCSQKCRGKWQSINQMGKNNPNYDVHITGEDHWNYGKFGKDSPAWKGGINQYIRDHVLPINQCLHINKRFKDSHAHHISADVVVYIPKELHNHISHNMKTGKGMYEMNLLSLQYLKGEL